MSRNERVQFGIIDERDYLFAAHTSTFTLTSTRFDDRFAAAQNSQRKKKTLHTDKVVARRCEQYRCGRGGIAQ